MIYIQKIPHQRDDEFTVDSPTFLPSWLCCKMKNEKSQIKHTRRTQLLRGLTVLYVRREERNREEKERLLRKREGKELGNSCIMFGIFFWNLDARPVNVSDFANHVYPRILLCVCT